MIYFFIVSFNWFNNFDHSKLQALFYERFRNNYGTQIEKLLLFPLLMECLWCLHHHNNKYCTCIFRLDYFIYIFFMSRSLVVIIFIVRLNFKNIKINRLVSEFILIEQRRFFWSVHHHEIRCTRIILLAIYYLFYFELQFLKSYASLLKKFGIHYKEH